MMHEFQRKGANNLKSHLNVRCGAIAKRESVAKSALARGAEIGWQSNAYHEGKKNLFALHFTLAFEFIFAQYPGIHDSHTSTQLCRALPLSALFPPRFKCGVMVRKIEHLIKLRVRHVCLCTR